MGGYDILMKNQGGAAEDSCLTNIPDFFESANRHTKRGDTIYTDFKNFPCQSLFTETELP